MGKSRHAITVFVLSIGFLLPQVCAGTLSATFYSDPIVDGWVDGFQGTSNCYSGEEINQISTLRVGESTTVSWHEYRSFVSFDVSSLLGAEILSATLFLYQTDVVGSPYSTGGPIITDLVDYGDSLNLDDWCVSAIASSIGTISDEQSTGSKNLDVKTSLVFALAPKVPHVCSSASGRRTKMMSTAMLSLKVARLLPPDWLRVLKSPTIFHHRIYGPFNLQVGTTELLFQEFLEQRSIPTTCLLATHCSLTWR